MSYTEVDFTLSGKLFYRVAATFHEIAGGLYILYNKASDLQPVVVIPVASGLQLVESPTPAPPLPPFPPLSDQTFWAVLNGRGTVGAARAFGVDATSQPGKIILSTQAQGTVAIFTQSATVAVFRMPFLIDPPIVLI